MTAPAVAIPARMAQLPRDRRGYPIPAVVFRTNAGEPIFTVNDTLTRARLIAADACHICGQKLLRGRWFAGGPGSAFHPDGAYLDGPMHKECVEYALAVCPYLAAPAYVGGRTEAAATRRAQGSGLVFIDPTVDNARPALFVAVMASAAKRTANGYFQPRRPYIAVQYWRGGARLAPAEARALLDGSPYAPAV